MMRPDKVLAIATIIVALFALLMLYNNPQHSDFGEKHRRVYSCDEQCQRDYIRRQDDDFHSWIGAVI